MLVNPQTEQPSKEGLIKTAIVSVVSSAPEKQNALLSTVLERLLHPQLTAQVYSDTLLLDSLTRKHMAEAKSTPLAYAQRRLAVFELGLQAMLLCSDFERDERNSLFEKIDHERATWDDRIWELLVESGEYRHNPIGFINQML